MNQDEIIKKFNEKKYFEVLTSIDSSHLFFFKSYFTDLVYLGYGTPSKDDQSLNNKTPTVTIGSFEGEHNFIKYPNYIIQTNEVIEHFLNTPPESITNDSSNNFINKTYNTNFEEWENLIHQSLNLIEKNNFTKIVCSRDLSFQIENFNWQRFVLNLLEKNNFAKSSYFIFYKNGDEYFISLTPENLLSIKDNQLESMALAGSVPLTSSCEENETQELNLLNNEKLIREHGIVTDEIGNRFNQICENVLISPTSILKLDYIAHRHQKITGPLKEAVTLNQIIDLLHPTPAVGTMPKENGINIINQLEKKKRNFYAAPFGIITAKMTELAVGLRSATLKNNLLTIHSGCGVVKGSDPLLEWTETENKMTPFMRTIS
jgi:menaquinone-specific isochorismate synthase